MKVNLLKTTTLLGVLGALAVLPLQAQVTAIWTGPATGGEWNTAADWSTGLAPGYDVNQSTNAFIGAGTNVSYNLPMSAGGFGSLTENGTLNINTNGFNLTSVVEINPGGTGKIFINSGAVVYVTNTFGVTSNSVVALTNGASLTVGGNLIIGSGNTGGTSGANAGSSALMTNFGGALTAASTLLNPGNGSISAGCRLVIGGGTNNLGAFAMQRGVGAANAPLALGQDGLVISNGFVNTTSISVGNNAHGIMYLVNGIVTNSGAFTLKNATVNRPARFLQTGGLFVDADPNLISPTPSGTGDTVYTVTGGTNQIYGISFLGAGTDYFTNSGNIYVGAGGIQGNGTVAINGQLNSGGLFGAYEPWAGSVALKLSGGTFTFQTTDTKGSVNNIDYSGVLTGAGSLGKTGAGTLLLGGANTYSGNTYINAGTLALDVSGSLGSPKIVVGSGTTFDVSAVSGGYVLQNQTLFGYGTVNGAVSVASGAVVNPGSNNVTGTLTIDGSLTETNEAVNAFYLSSNAAGPNNDLLSVAGDLDISGTNLVSVSGSLPSGATYKLISYTGNFNGGITNFALAGAIGVLTNDVVGKTISLITLATVRGPASTVWLGNPLNTNWDTSISTNWLNAGKPDFFIPGDSVTFTDLGASNGPINLVGSLYPAAVTINSTSNYVFAGNGAIAGSTGLTKTNSGTLTILTTNSYTGFTAINGGTLAINNLPYGGSPGPLGAATSDPGNLGISNATLNYFGPSTTSDRGDTLGGTASLDLPGGTTVTLSGVLQGSGGLALVDSGTLILSGPNSYTGVTTLNNGVLEISSIANALGANTVDLAGGTLSFTGVGGQPTFTSAFTVVTNSTVISGGNDIVSGNWTGATNVTLNLSIPGSGNTFSVNGNLTNFLGTVELGASVGTLRFNAGGGNTMVGAPNTIFDLGSGTANLTARNPGTMALGALEGGYTTILTGPGSTAGTLIWQIGSSTNQPSSIFYGNITKTPNANEILGITKVGPGVLTLAGQNTYLSTTTISSGTLALTNNVFTGSDGSIDDSATVNLVAGAFLDVSGRSDGTFQNTSTQTLEGRGTILGSLNVNGTVVPGGGFGGNTGTLTVTNAVALNGTAWLKINRANTPNSDQVVSTLGTLTYGGTLVVTNIGAALKVGDTFTLFSALTYAGAFGNLALPNYYNWDTSQLTVNGTIRVTGVLPPPAFSQVDFSQLANGSITLNAINGALNGPVTVLSTTNLTLPLSSWTTVTTGNFDGSGNYSVSVTADPAAPQEYYLLQAQ